MSNRKEEPPKVWIYPRAYYLFSLWAAEGGKKGREMTCFGRVEIEDKDLVVTDAYMIKHEGSSASCDGDEDDIIRLMMELNADGIPPDELRCWTHSHPGTGPNATFLSGTDEQNIDRYLTGEFLVSIVFDSRGEHPYCRIDFRTSDDGRYSVEADLEMYIPYLTYEEVEWAKKEYKDKSRASTPTVYMSPKRGKGKGKGKVNAKGYPTQAIGREPAVGDTALPYYREISGMYQDDDEEMFDWDHTTGNWNERTVSDYQAVKKLAPPRVTSVAGVEFHKAEDGTIEIEVDDIEDVAERSDDLALAALAEFADAEDDDAEFADGEMTIAELWNQAASSDGDGDDTTIGDGGGLTTTVDADGNVTLSDNVLDYGSDIVGTRASGAAAVQYYEAELQEICHEVATGEVQKWEAVRYLMSDRGMEEDEARSELERYLGVEVH